MLTAVVVYGAAMGGLFALAFAFLYGRIGDLSPRVLALLLAVAGVRCALLCAEPEISGESTGRRRCPTIGYRTGLYLLMLLISLGGLSSRWPWETACRSGYSALKRR